MRILKQYSSRVFLGLGLLLTGCSTVTTNTRWMPVDELGRLAGTGFEAIDLMVACNEIGEIMNTLVSSPNATEVSIVVEPVVNDTRFALPREAFDAAILLQLRSNAPPKCQVFNPDSAMEPGIFLMGRLQRVMPDRSRDHEVLLYSYQLVDARNNEVFWESSYEVVTHLPAEAEIVVTETSVER